jgi:hypothetical protein
MMELRFPQSEIPRLAARYDDEMGERDKRLTMAITQDVFPSYARNGFLTKKEFLTVCEWKTPRSRPRCESNDEGLIREVSALARTTESERMRIQIWTLLAGVKWPTASVFLHFAFLDRYPILDFRALWSLKTAVPAQYTFDFWSAYADFCRKLARQAGVSMRILDQALWKYSEIHQRR